LERRYGIRYPASAVVYVSSLYGPLVAPGLVSDVSISGCFICTLLPWPPLGWVGVRLLSLRRDLKVQARVVRQTGAGIGIEWSTEFPALVREIARRPLGCEPLHSAS
jgi:hypothetical protein